uniref:Transcriptional regulator family protein n=1 Tax=Anatid alphaherpesvirus 2 TaxID=3080522 RepID=A0AAU0K739_9ALPH
MDGSRVSWDDLLTHGPELRRAFETRSRASAMAVGLREAVVRSETFVETLASVDETLAWIKMHAVLNLPLVSGDPILATAGAVLDALKNKLSPVMTCRHGSNRRSIEDMLRRASPDDVNDPLTLALIMLARLTQVMRHNRGSYSARASDVDPLNSLGDYVPGACMTGILDYLDLHVKTCADHACKLYASYILTPVYTHGKYFYCNDMF